MNKPKAVAVVGPTSSGKTSLAIKIAQQFDGEVISADSRQVYTGLNLGTGKVSFEEMQGVPHHLIDIADPKENYTAAEFELDATAAILDIRNRGKLPIVAGGTFFYLDMLRGIHNSAPVPPNESFRFSLDGCSTDQLYTKLKQSDPERAETIDSKNRSRLVRALEIIQSLGKVPKPKKNDSPYQWLIIGIDIDKVRLHENIHERLQERLEAGLILEVENLHKDGLSYERLEELGLEYKLIAKHLQHEMPHQKLVTKLVTKNCQYAKRQMTWLKKDKEIEWFKPNQIDRVYERASAFLQE